MEEQSGREFASANPTAGAQDATLQERGLSPEVPLNPRRRLQHFQRHCHVREFYLSTPLRTQRPHQGKSIIWRALSRSRILLVNPAARSKIARCKINQLAGSTPEQIPPKMA